MIVLFKEADLEKVFIDLLVQEGCKYVPGEAIDRGEGEVLIEQDLRDYLHRRYDSEGITENEIRSVVLQLRSLSASALYESNKKFCSWLSDGFMLKRENPKDKDILIELLDFRPLGEQRKTGFGIDADEEPLPQAADVSAKYCADCNIVKIVNQFEIVGTEKLRKKCQKRKSINFGLLYLGKVLKYILVRMAMCQRNFTMTPIILGRC